jgi:hypothetical protein
MVAIAVEPRSSRPSRFLDTDMAKPPPSIPMTSTTARGSQHSQQCPVWKQKTTRDFHEIYGWYNIYIYTYIHIYIYIYKYTYMYISSYSTLISNMYGYLIIWKICNIYLAGDIWLTRRSKKYDMVPRLSERTSRIPEAERNLFVGWFPQSRKA